MPRTTKRPIVVGSYKKPFPDGWIGWVEDKARRWILFYTEDGSALFYAKRDKKGGVDCPGVASIPPKKPKAPTKSSK